jgi:hypothetical protein
MASEPRFAAISGQHIPYWNDVAGGLLPRGRRGMAVPALPAEPPRQVPLLPRQARRHLLVAGVWMHHLPTPGDRPVTTDPRDPAFIEPAYVTCKACLGEGFVDVGELVETCFDCNGEGVFEL